MLHLALDLLGLELRRLERRCQPKDGVAVSPGLRALALVRGRALDSCRERLRDMVTAAAQKVWRRPLTSVEVKAIVAHATAGLFPEAEDGQAEDEDDEEQASGLGGRAELS